MCYNYIQLSFGDNMSKINIKVMLENKTEHKFFNNEIRGIVTDNKIKYMDNEVSVIIYLKDDQVIIERKSKDYFVSIPLLLNQNTRGIYDIKNLGLIDLMIYTNKMDISDTVLDIEYQLIIDKEVTNDFHFHLEMEDVL